MTLDELTDKKQSLEDSIRNLIAGFIDDTDLSDLEIDITVSPLKVPSPDKPNEFKIIAQSVEVKVTVSL